MKKLLILHILLFVFTIVCNAQMYSTSSYIQQRPGYNVYQTNTINTQATLGYSNGRRIGYSTYRGEAFEVIGYYNGVYTPPKNYGGSGCGMPGGGPKKVSGGLGWITWLTWGMYHGVPSNASNEDMYNYYDYIDNGGSMGWDDWYASMHVGPPSPGDPFADPIGNFPLLLLLPLVIGYCFYRKRKTVSV